ncbi:MAG: protein-tyrosine phosphatase family protein [Caldilineaceae bacterium]
MAQFLMVIIASRFYVNVVSMLIDCHVKSFPAVEGERKDKMANIYWIEGPWRGRLAIMARPRGDEWLQREVDDWRRNRIDVVVSLLTQSEIDELALTQEARVAEINGITFFAFPIPDRGVPASLWKASSFIRQLEDLLADGRHVAIHCRHGIGRSALVAAGLLVRSGIDVAAAFTRIERSRGCPVPDTSEQKNWVEKFAALTPVPAFG